MIKYQLICALNHEFEGWFRDSADYDAQRDSQFIDCPACGSSEVRKAIMAPAIARSGALAVSSAKAEKLNEIRSEYNRVTKKARDFVEKNFDYVGEKFPEEARRIHYGETEKRDIYGEASGKDVKSLVDEGVPVAPVPGAPAKPAPKKRLN